MKSYSKSVFLEALKKFSTKRIIVIGDVMLDKFIYGDVERISQEAPVPIIREKTEEMVLGGAGNTCRNIKSFGADVDLIGIFGDDRYREDIELLFEKSNIPLARKTHFMMDPNRRTTVKTRVIAGSQQVCRIDKEDVTPVGREFIENAISYLEESKEYDGIIISDYNKGVITKDLLYRLRYRYPINELVSIADPKFTHVELFNDFSMITPNHKETKILTGMSTDSDDEVIEAGKRLLNDVRCKSVLVTRGSKGMCLVEDNTYKLLPSVVHDVSDVTGAGDTVAAVAALSLCSGLSNSEAAFLSNCAAGIVVEKVGTAVVSTEELIKRINSLEIEE